VRDDKTSKLVTGQPHQPISRNLIFTPVLLMWHATFSLMATILKPSSLVRRPSLNFVKERSGLHDLDGAALVRTVFSKQKPILAFNDLSDQTDQDQQEGLMHLFEGAVLGIRNPGGHSFPEGTEQRAIEYISLLSLLAYLVQEARRRPKQS
jgi:uncharacterized protein (TIGR02391 family)